MKPPPNVQLKQLWAESRMLSEADWGLADGQIILVDGCEAVLRWKALESIGKQWKASNVMQSIDLLTPGCCWHRPCLTVRRPGRQPDIKERQLSGCSADRFYLEKVAPDHPRIQKAECQRLLTFAELYFCQCSTFDVL